MPIDRSKYPSNWKAIVAQVRARSGDRCECRGECGLHRGRRCVERHREDARFAGGRVILTTAHLDHDTTNNVMSNLRHMCNRCHLRYDADHHAANAAATRERKRSSKGQMEFYGATP